MFVIERLPGTYNRLGFELVYGSEKQSFSLLCQNESFV